ncbi:hypothetical protein [Bacillus sp. CGMCC 1.16541]|uniref:DUF6843 domain-containing protein n=1 Tax=Bacillus sp. CGMCC 1.16541 TaxID=2185143 RepID=UPI000D727FFF|nr:hypothetical protein [Bacillus sp. CGMCC 1.16541]
MGRYLVRKVWISLIVALLIGVLFVSPGVIDSGVEALVYGPIVFIYAIPFIVLYGMPVSILSDFFVKKIAAMWLKVIISFLIHVGFGTIPFLLASLYFDGLREGIGLVGLGALLYWIVYLIFEVKSPITYLVTWPIATPAAFVTAAVIIVYFVQAIDNIGEPVIYKIPEDYRGVVKIYYNDEDAKPLKQQDKYFIAPINENGILRTSTPTPSGVYTYTFVNEEGEEVENHHNLLHFDNVLTSEFEYEQESESEITSFFVGTKAEAKKYYGENEQVYTADFRSEATYQFYVPQSFRGWAVVELGEELKITEQTPYSIYINNQGIGKFPLTWIDYQQQADKFFFVSSTGEQHQIMKDMIHEPMLYPDLFAVFVGTKEEYKKSKPFHYITYKEKLSQYKQ